MNEKLTSQQDEIEALKGSKAKKGKQRWRREILFSNRDNNIVKRERLRKVLLIYERQIFKMAIKIYLENY